MLHMYIVLIVGSFVIDRLLLSFALPHNDVGALHFTFIKTRMMTIHGDLYTSRNQQSE